MVRTGPQSEGPSSFLRAARAGNLEKVLEYLNGSMDINTSNMNGMNALHLASKEGHSEMVKELLKRGADVNAGTNKGNTALHIASLGGRLEVVEILVENEANVNAQSFNGFTPLYMAAQENHDTVVRYLLSHGANQSLATEDGFTPLAVALQQGHDKVVTILLENDTKGKVRLPALHIAAKKDDCKAAALLLQSDQKPDVTSKSGFTPLHIAAHYGNENIATLLLDKGANINFTAKHKITPLHVAAKWGKAHMAWVLLNRGAQIDAATRDGLTPLHCAARSGHEPVVELLLKRGAPYSAKTKNGLAPLHMASQGDHIDSARTLLAYKAPVDDVTVDFLTPLHVAAHCGHVKVAKLLLDHKANVNARALNGFVPLHIACKKNRIKVVELLLKHGASIEVTTESGLTPLHVASFMGCINIVIYLIQNGADVDGATVRGETPIHLAARASQAEIIKILLRNGALVDRTAREDQTALHIASRLNNTEIVQLLLARGASVDVATKDQYTALHIAAKEGHREVAAYLLEQGASLTATTKKGFTPLHLAAKYGKITVAGLLLEKEAPVDAQGKNGVTPLHVAAHYDHVNVALLLLEKKASPHATAKNGYTPLHIAAKKKQIEIATTLLEYGAEANAESKAGFTPLHLAAQEGHTDMGELLISHKANVNAKSKLELTPLHLAAQGDRVAVAQVLLRKRADVNAQTKQGYTPLHVACHNCAVGMIKLLLQAGANVDITTQHGYTPLHQAAQQGHTLVINLLLDHKASPNKTTNLGYTPLAIAQKCNYISVVETLKTVTEVTTTSIITTTTGEKYSYNNPETMQETFMTTDSEDEGGEGADNWEKANLNYEKGDGHEYNKHDESFGFDVTHDESISRAGDLSGHAPLIADESISPSHIIMQESMINNFTPDNIDISRPPTSVGRLKWKTFLVSFMVDARGGAMRGCRHSGVRIIIPPRKAPMPMRITCRYLRREKLIHPPPLMEGEACASRILEVGPSGAKFLGPVIIEVPHFAAMRGKEREIIILRSDDGESWREHTLEASEEAVREILNESFQGESDLNNLEPEFVSDRITRILTTDFPQYFAVITRIRQEVHAIGPEGGMVNSTVVPQVQAIFPEGALTKKIKVGLQAQPIASELVAKMLGNRVAVSPIVTVEPRRRKFHKPITLTIPVPQAATRGMINNYTGDTPTLRLLCSITGGTSKAQWEDVTGSTPLTFVNQCVSFTTTVSARFWLMDCRQINEATKFATDLYREATAVPFMSKFVVFSKRHEPAEAQMRIFCMTDDKEDKTLENQEQFTEVAKSRDVEVLEGKPQFLEFAGNLVPVTKSGEQLNLIFQAFRENRLPFLIRVRDTSQEPFGKIAFMKEPRKTRGEAPQVPICNLNIKLPDTIVEEEPTINNHQQFADVQFIKTETIQRSALDDHDIILNADPSIMLMGQELGKDWIKIASHLDIDPQDTEKIKKQFPNQESEQATALLYTVDRKSSLWNNKDLCKILWDIGRKDLITKFYPNYNRYLAEFGIKLNGKLEERSESIKSSKSLPTDREVNLDDKDIMKDAESMDDSEGESVGGIGQPTATAATTNNKVPSHEVKGGEDEERSSAVQQYLKYLEDEDREDSEERAAFRGEKTNSNELYIIKEEIQVPSGDSSSIKSTKQTSTPLDPTQEAESHVKTEERVEFTDEGGLTHSITQVTKTTIVQEVEEPIQVQQRLQKQQSSPQQAQAKQESAYSNEPDTISQMSISSIPEDDKSDPTSANISSATTTTTNASDVRTSSVTEEPGTKITVEQNGNSDNQEEYHLIAESILRQVYDEVFELIRTKKIAIDDKEWFETEASGDVFHIIEQSTTCERTSDKSGLEADENYHEMSYSEKKDYFSKLSNDSKVKPVPPAPHYCRSSSIETSGMGKDDNRRPSEGEIVESVGAFQDRRAYFESTGGRRSFSIDTANIDEARTAYSTSLAQRSSTTTAASIVPGTKDSVIGLIEQDEEKDNSMDARRVNQICTPQLTNSTINESIKDNVASESDENRLSSLNDLRVVDGLNGSLSLREPDDSILDNQDHVSPLGKPSPPEVVDTKTMEQVVSPIVDFPDYLTPEVQTEVGISPTEAKSTKESIVDATEPSKDDRPEIESTDLADDVIIETVKSMAFDNSAFEGADAIDAREELDDGAVSPFEIVREETNDILSTRPSFGSPIDDPYEDEVMRQLESERIEYRDIGGQNQSDLKGSPRESDVDTVFIPSTDLLHQENKLSADCDEKSSTIVHGSSRLHSASEIEENVVVWETTIHQHSIEIQDEVSEMISNGMKVRLEEKTNEDAEKSESTDSTSLKKEARELANQIVGQVKETIQSQPPLRIIESVSISDEDLVELSDEQSIEDEPPKDESNLVHGSLSSEKLRIEKQETSEIIVDANGQEYLITETKTTEERTRSETTIKQDEIQTDNEPDVKMRVKTIKHQGEDELGGSGSGSSRDQRFSTDSDRLANLSGAGASLSSTPTSSDRKFVSCLSQSPGSSRPTSSEFDHLVPGFGQGHGGSWTGPSGSEYETAATSQASSSYVSANQAAASGDSASYVTAKSSRESTISVDSDHSFNCTDSETSETLMTGGNFNDNQTPVPQSDPIRSGKVGQINAEEDDEEDEDGSSTPINNDLESSQVKEPYECEIPEDVIRSGIEIPFMSGSCNWELIEKPESLSSPSSPFEIIPITNDQMTDLLEETPEKMLGEKVSAIPGLPAEPRDRSTSVTVTTATVTTTATTIKSGASQGSGNDENDQPSISDGSVTWLSSSLGTAVGMGNSFDSSTGGQTSDRVGGPVSGFTDSANSFDALGQLGDNLGTGDAMSSLESQDQGHSSKTNLNNQQTVNALTSAVAPLTTTVTSSSPEMLGLVSGSDAVEISDFERYDVDRSSLEDFSPGLRLPEHGRDNLGGSLSSVNDINEIPSEAAANDTPLISQSSVASSILSEQARHQLSYDLSPEIPCPGSGSVGESVTARSDDTQLFSEGDTRPQSPIPPNDFGPNVVSSIGMYDTWEEKSPCSDDIDACMMMTPSVSDVNMPLPSSHFLPSSGNGLTPINLIEGITELGRIEEEEEFGYAVSSSKIVQSSMSSGDDFRPITLGFDRSKPIPVTSIAIGHITTVIEGSHEGSSTGSSLQEFEKLEAEVTSAKNGPSNRPAHHGSSDSIGSFGSIGGKPLHGKGSQGDDSLSVNSLMEFEKLESECRDAEVIESAARDEAARLSEIEEGHESQASDSQETLSDQGKSDEEDDYERRIREIDELIGASKTESPKEAKTD